MSLKNLNPDEQTVEICLEAVKRDGRTLKYIKNQTLEICREAVKNDSVAKNYISDSKLSFI